MMQRLSMLFPADLCKLIEIYQQPIPLVACGPEFTLCQTLYGAVYGFGPNCGCFIPVSKDAVDRPQLISAFRDVRKIACGISHVAILLFDGSLFTLGSNEFKQRGFTQNNVVQKQTPYLVLRNIRDVACGSDHTIALDNDGTVFAFGRNHYGQLGIGSFQSCNGPQKTAEDVTMIATNWSADTFFLVKNKQVLACGSNLHGQMGLDRSWRTLRVIPNIQNVKSILCGHYYTIVLHDDGRLSYLGLGKRDE
jgi:alpha-tubulin suppressor-like RCC1 family protein